MSDPDYTGTCECGKVYTNNCAHFLSEWMINKGYISKNPKGSTPGCRYPEGRAIRAKEMRDVFKNMGLKQHFNPLEKLVTKKDGTKIKVPQPCFIYCERNEDHQGHVYYGTKGNDYKHHIAGTGDGWFGADYFEFYY